MLIKCAKTKLIINRFITKKIFVAECEHPMFTLCEKNPIGFIENLPYLPNDFQKSLGIIVSFSSLDAVYRVEKKLNNFLEFKVLANEEFCENFAKIVDFFLSHREKFPRLVIDDNTNNRQLLMYREKLVDIIDEYKKRLFKENIPETIAKKRELAFANSNKPWTSKYKFTFAQAREVLNLLPYFWNKREGEDFKKSSSLANLWLKILMTSAESLEKNPFKFSAKDIYEFILELEVSFISHELRTLAIRHLKKLLEICETIQNFEKSGDSVSIENDETDEKENILRKLHESSFVDKEDDSFLRARKGVTLSDGTFLALPRMSDFADKTSYFAAMSEYRMKIREDKMRTRIFAQEQKKENKKKTSQKKLEEYLKALNDDDF